MPLRIAVFGAGAAGGLIAGFLSDAGYEVGLIARGGRLAIIRDEGLRIESYIRPVHARPAIVTSDPAEVGTVDAVILCVKAWQVIEAANALKPLLKAGTCILTQQNGVEAPSQVASIVGEEHALVGVGTFVALSTGLNQVKHIADVHPTFRFGEALHFGEQKSRPSARVAALRQALEKAGFSVATPPDINVDTELWAKFAGVATNGGMGAITRAPAGVWRSLPGSRQMRLDAVHEVLAIARAKGVRFSASIASDIMGVLDAYPPQMTASMQRDIMEGKRSELEEQLGAIVRLGKESGIPTPVNTLIYAALLPQELRARQGAEGALQPRKDGSGV